MKLNLRLLMLAGSLGLITLMPSCQSTSATATTGSEAVMCDKCKTVWVKQPVGIGGPAGRNAVMYRDSKTMTCPDCSLAIANFWKTGSMKHTCSSCGGTRTHCTLCTQ